MDFLGSGWSLIRSYIERKYLYQSKRTKSYSAKKVVDYVNQQEHSSSSCPFGFSLCFDNYQNFVLIIPVLGANCLKIKPSLIGLYSSGIILFLIYVADLIQFRVPLIIPLSYVAPTLQKYTIFGGSNMHPSTFLKSPSNIATKYSFLSLTLSLSHPSLFLLTLWEEKIWTLERLFLDRKYST